MDQFHVTIRRGATVAPTPSHCQKLLKMECKQKYEKEFISAVHCFLIVFCFHDAYNHLTSLIMHCEEHARIAKDKTDNETNDESDDEICFHLCLSFSI